MLKKIVIKGAKEHNLKNVSVEIPKDKLIVITGLSGSGKYSLAFYTIYAEGFYRALHQVSVLNKPIIVTENGIADKVDDKREKYINEYLYALFRALEDGIDIRGYYYWSLLDNFEWAFGYDMKFGLYEVDFKTQKRTLREGAKIYQRIVQENH